MPDAMTSFDPYLLLGLARDANAASVKSAYRQAVQRAHPDRGGDPEGFIAIVRAFGVLSDPDARRLFDETGVVDDDVVRDYRREVATLLVDMFDAAVSAAISTGMGLDRVDFIAQMRDAVTAGLEDARARLYRVDAEIDSLTRLRSRIRRRHGAEAGRNLFVDRLDGQIGSRTTEHATVKKRVAMLDAAVVELDNYESDVELIAALEVVPGE